MNYDVIVVGAGPGGSTAAKVCAENGLKVVLIEKHKQAGFKVCAGGLESKVLKEFDIEESVIECYPQRFYICGENRWVVREEESVTVYRKNFDRYLADSAVVAGSSFYTSTRCVQVLKKDQKVIGIAAQSSKGLEKILGDVVIAADGYHSVTARSAGLQPPHNPSDVGLCVQYELYLKSKVRDDGVFLFYGGKVSPCGYGWIYPKKNGYTVGVGCLMSHLRGKLTQNLNYLLYRHPIASRILSKPYKISNLQGACVPAKPSSSICGDGIVVVGDAAGQVNLLSGAGIYTAMKAGTLAGKVVTEAISEGDVSKTKLRKYQEIWNLELGNELKRQKLILERVKNYFVKYMEVQIFLERYSKVKRIFDTCLTHIKPFLFRES